MTPKTPSTQLVALILAISWLPRALAADTGSSDLVDPESPVLATFEQELEADVERTLRSALRQKVDAEVDALMVREHYRLSWLSRHGGTSPASPAPPGAAADSRATSSSETSENGRSGVAGAPSSGTLCSFSPPSTFVCTLQPETRFPASPSP